MKSIKNKKGFTLIELLAVIIILSVLMLIAVPGILKLMDNSKQNAFVTQAQMIYKTATEQFVVDSTSKNLSNGVTYCKDINNSASSNKLELTGNDKVYYKIQMDSEGKILNYHITNNVYSVKDDANGNKDISSINSDKVKTGTDYEEVSCGE